MSAEVIPIKGKSADAGELETMARQIDDDYDIRRTETWTIRKGALPETVDKLVPILVRNAALLRMFQYAEGLVRPYISRKLGPPNRHGERGWGETLALAPVSQTRLQSAIDKVVELKIERNNKSGGTYEQRTDCPERLAKLILESPDVRDENGWPRLEGMSSVPLFDGEGLHDQQGLYNGIWINCPQSISLPKPSEAAAAAAMKRLEGTWLSEFPFASQRDRTIAIAGLMLAALRPSLGTAPMLLVTKPSYGAGASTLVKIFGAVLTGLIPAVLAAGDDPAELEKVVTAALLEGLPCILLDNLPEGIPLRSSKLAQACSEISMRPREFGKTVSREVPLGRFIAATGVNVLPAMDMARRTLVCHLDPQMERPEGRSFKHADIVREVLDKRVEILTDVFTIVNSFLRSGATVKVEALAGYEQFTDWVVKPLVWLGRDDLNAGVRESAASDPTTELLGELLPAIEKIAGLPENKGRDGLTIAEMRERGELSANGKTKRWEYASKLEGILAEATTAKEIAGRLQLNGRAVGKFFTKIAGRVKDGRRLVKAGVTDGASRWRVEGVKGIEGVCIALRVESYQDNLHIKGLNKPLQTPKPLSGRRGKGASK